MSLICNLQITTVHTIFTWYPSANPFIVINITNKFTKSLIYLLKHNFLLQNYLYRFEFKLFSLVIAECLIKYQICSAEYENIYNFGIKYSFYLICCFIATKLKNIQYFLKYCFGVKQDSEFGSNLISQRSVNLLQLNISAK